MIRRLLPAILFIVLAGCASQKPAVNSQPDPGAFIVPLVAKITDVENFKDITTLKSATDKLVHEKRNGSWLAGEDEKVYHQADFWTVSGYHYYAVALKDSSKFKSYDMSYIGIVGLVDCYNLVSSYSMQSCHQISVHKLSAEFSRIYKRINGKDCGPVSFLISGSDDYYFIMTLEPLTNSNWDPKNPGLCSSYQDTLSILRIMLYRSNHSDMASPKIF